MESTLNMFMRVVLVDNANINVQCVGIILTITFTSVDVCMVAYLPLVTLVSTDIFCAHLSA